MNIKLYRVKNNGECVCVCVYVISELNVALFR